VRLLDTLEVLAHDRYEALLKKTGVINEEFLDYRTRVVVRVDADGNETVGLETTRAGVDVTEDTGSTGAVVIEDQDTREQEATEEVAGLAQQIAPRNDVPPLRVPLLKMSRVELKFSLADITDLDAFEKLGRRLATDPDDDLRRMELGARIVTGPDGLRRTELVTTTGDRVVSAAATIPLAEARARLVDAVLGAEIVPPHEREARAAERIVDVFVKGLGAHADEILSAYGDRAAARLVRETPPRARGPR
jgi:type III restriction enzyme